MSRRQREVIPQLSPAVFYNATELGIIDEIRRYIEARDFPCVGAKAALSQDAIAFRVYDRLAEKEGTTGLHLDLMEYVQSIDIENARIQSFVAIFRDSDVATETEFENRLFGQLQHLMDESETLSIGWNSEVSSDPSNPHFSMSIAGHPFFIVGMHPNASRAARRTPYPTLVFNSNLQFNKLKEDGRYDKLKAIIRQRELEINGSINPMLDDFGRSSEVRQYSGRQVGAEWECPFNLEADKGQAT